MATFTLDTSILGGNQFSTRHFEMNGDFRELQFRFYNSSGSQDMEPHFLEFHYMWDAVSGEEI